jgi:hypothetical protein
MTETKRKAEAIPLEEMRHIPLHMRQDDVARLDAAAKAAGLSRAAWMRRELLDAADKAGT